MRRESKSGNAQTNTAQRRLSTVLRGTCLMLGLSGLLGGCLLTDAPEPGLDIPHSYDGSSRKAAVAEAALPKLDWWRGFRSRELTMIVEQARAANLDIAAAIARIVQADAQARVAGASLLPDISLGSSATRSRSSQTTSGSTISSGGERDSLSATLSASYEIDFWGKNRSALRAAEEPAAASRFDREVVGLTTVASAANAYFQVLASQDRLKAARENLGSANRVLDLIKQRVNAGTASALETAQQESVVNTQRAAIPPLQQTLKQNRNALAVLMARSPESVRVRGGSLRSLAVPRVTPGLPSELLAQRPDIRQPEANLAAANANVENARAQMLPSITLTADGGYSSAVLKTLLRPESMLFSLGAGLTQPIFDGQRLQGNLDLQKGKQDELLQTYRKAVISGFADVENALDAIRQTAVRERLQGDVVSSSRRAFDIAEQRLREGTVDLVTVLQTQQTLYSAQDAQIQARLAHMQAIVSLYQALGGGWLPKPIKAADAR
ncbi:MAG: efflux transporter outer membrane subunit [Pseudolabrys sp.]|nr:efflux transporter outer membrane subunit [Pseudolabrys sp.]